MTEYVTEFNREHPELVNEDGTHPLHTGWVLWSHLPSSKNNKWDLPSYRKHATLRTVEDFWNVYNGLPSLVNQDMWFLMREGIPPIWEHEINSEGGSFKFRVPGAKLDNIWLTLSRFLVTENMCIDPEDSLLISGISMSPKQNNFFTVNIWNMDSASTDCTQFPSNIDGIDFKMSRYHAHSQRRYG